MPSKTVTVGSSVGLHARPAAIISEAAGELDSEVTLAVPGEEPVDAASSLLIMTLGAACGDQVEVVRRRPGGRGRDRGPGREGPRRLTAASPSRARRGAGPRGVLVPCPTVRSGRPFSRQVRSMTSGVAPPSRPAASGRNATRSSSCQYAAARGSWSSDAAPVDVRPAEGERRLDPVQAGEVRGAVRDVEVGGSGRRLHPVDDPAHPAVADQSTLAGWKSRCRNVASYAGGGSASRAKASR